EAGRVNGEIAPRKKNSTPGTSLFLECLAGCQTGLSSRQVVQSSVLLVQPIAPGGLTVYQQQQRVVRLVRLEQSAGPFECRRHARARTPVPPGWQEPRCRAALRCRPSRVRSGN